MKIRLLPILLSAALTLSALPAFASSSGLQGEMDKMFGQMSTSTSPQVSMGAQRGVITGGSLQIRSPVTPQSAQLLNFQPPSFSAGCSGISLYGGSFSFISGQQFVQLLRSIAANAEGLAFQMALQAMSSQLSQQLSSLSDKIQQMTSTTLNSCNIAHEAMNATGASSAISSFGSTVGQSMSTAYGDVTDSFGAASGDTPQTPAAQTAAANHPAEMAKIVYQNVVWAALQTHQIGMSFGGSSPQQLEADIMSLTGTVIVCNPQTNTACAPGDGDAGGTGMDFVAPTITLEDLVYGSTSGTAQVLSCGSDTQNCMNPTPQAWTSPGFLQMMTTALGTNGTTGVLGALLTNEPSNPQVAAFLGNAGAAGPLLMRIAQVNPSALQGYAQAIAEPLAIEMAHQQAIQMITVVETALQGEPNPAAKQQLIQLNAKRKEIDSEYQSLRNQGNFNVDALNLANAYIQTAPGSMPANNYGTAGN